MCVVSTAMPGQWPYNSCCQVRTVVTTGSGNSLLTGKMARLIDSALRTRPVLREELHSFIRTYMSVCKVFVVVVCPPVDNSNWRKFFYFRCVGSFLQLDFYHSFLELFVRFLSQLLQTHFVFWNLKSGLGIQQAGIRLRPRCCFIIIFNPQFWKFAYL